MGRQSGRVTGDAREVVGPAGGSRMCKFLEESFGPHSETSNTTVFFPVFTVRGKGRKEKSTCLSVTQMLSSEPASIVHFRGEGKMRYFRF